MKTVRLFILDIVRVLVVILGVFLLLSVILACRKEVEPVLVVSETEIDMPYVAGEYTITLDASMLWIVRVDQSSETEEWITFPGGMSGQPEDHTLTIRFPENPGHDRTAILTIALKGTVEYKKVPIRQEGYLDMDMRDELDPELTACWMAQNPSWEKITRYDLLTCKSLTLSDLSSSATLKGLHLFPVLQSLFLRNCELSSPCFGEIPWLKSIYFETCTIASLDLTGNEGLETLTFTDTSLKTLDTRSNPALFSVDFEIRDRFPDIEVVRLGPGVEYFTACNAHALREVDCSVAEKLTYLEVPNCDIHRLDLSKTQIAALEIRMNPIDELLLPPTLERLMMHQCTGSISRLDIGDAAVSITVSGTTITELNFGNAASLSYVYCCNNLLSYLDLSHLSLPEYLNFGGNPGASGVFELRVSSADFPAAKALFEGMSWWEDISPVITHVISNP